MDVITTTTTITDNAPPMPVGPSATTASRIQRLNKASSDQLLRKFAEMDSDSDIEKVTSAKKTAKRRRRSSRKIGGSTGETENMCSSLMEVSSSLISPSGTRRSASFLKQLGISKSKLRSRDLKNRSVLVTLEKTWSKAVRGASRVFMEKHYNRHRRLISDPIAA